MFQMQGITGTNGGSFICFLNYTYTRGKVSNKHTFPSKLLRAENSIEGPTPPVKCSQCPALLTACSTPFPTRPDPPANIVTKTTLWLPHLLRVEKRCEPDCVEATPMAQLWCLSVPLAGGRASPLRQGQPGPSLAHGQGTADCLLGVTGTHPPAVTLNMWIKMHIGPTTG